MRRRDVEDLYRLSPVQEGMLFHSLHAPEAAMYCDQFGLSFGAGFDAGAFEQAWRDVVAAVPALRTSFRWKDLDAPVQVVHRQVELTLACRDLSRLPPARRAAERRRLLLADRRGFDLARPPLLRLALLQLSGDEVQAVWTYHHLLCDGWSFGLVLSEVGAAYEARRRGEVPLLPPRPPFRDYIAWLRRQDLAAAEAYWRAVLDGVRGPTRLGVDAAPGAPPALAALYETRTRDLEAPAAERLDAFARRHRLTLGTLLAGAWARVLAAFAGDDEVVFGVAVSGRPPSLPGAEEVVGCFINTLPLRVRPAADRPLVDTLREVQRSLAEMRRFEHSPLGEVRRWAGVPAGTQLFDTVLVLEKFPASPASGPRFERWQRSNFPLLVQVVPKGGIVELSIGFDRGRFTPTAAARLLAALRRVLEAMAAEDAERLGDLPVLSPAERHQLLCEWGAAPAPYPREATVHGLFAEQAAAPDRVALVAGDACWTYGELDRRANRFARRLRALGVGPETVVGIHLERGLELVAVFLAVLKAGGAYLPLDPGLPAARLAVLAADAGASLAVTAGGQDALAAAGLATLDLERDAAAIAAEDDRPLPEAAGPDGLVYVLFTSGSTGRPKGVAAVHRGVVRLVRGTRFVDLDPDGTFLLAAPASFDASTLEIWGPLLNGARLVIAPPQPPSPPELTAAVERHRVSCLWLTTGLFNQWVETAPRPPPDLRWLLFGGETASPPHVERARRALAGCRLVHAYGPTENTTFTTCGPVDAPPPPGAGLPIGRPIANSAAWLFDRRLEPVAPGVPGELYAGGDGLARGYVGRPAWTAKRFVPHPFPKLAGERLYRTGDLARFLPDGRLDFLGRTDRQVKLRGFRIEPGEVEAVLREHPAVAAARVVVREDRPGDRRLVAYLTAGGEADPGDLARHLRRRLPEHLVPSAFVVLEAFPLAPHGKVDEAALPPPGDAALARGGVLRPPGREIEATLAGIWRRLLGVEQLGVDDNFFDLGGHSLLLIRLQNELRRALGREVPIADLFRHPTVAALAELLDPAAEGREPPRSEAGRRRAEVRRSSGRRQLEIAVVGMSGRFPGAADPDALWRLLLDGVEAIRFFTPEEAIARGADPRVVEDPAWVGAAALVDDLDRFDAELFELTPREAELLDPQQRLFLECAWQALEHAGCDPARHPGAVGVYAGVGLNRYWRNLLLRPDVLATIGEMQLQLGNDKDFLPTRVSYKLDLRGPSVNVQTACSTSLVAVHLACQALAQGECDVALAGGVSLTALAPVGYRYQEGAILSPDGHCRAFDAAAGGTIGGSGAALVLLKRLEDALAEGDTIHAVIRGSAINNDGSGKLGFTAPSVDGQAAVVAEALAMAGLPPERVGFIETHGTGTALGDPIEVAALQEVFGDGPEKRCALGALKTNIGHLDTAAGAAGLIKAVLALEHRRIPPTLHFERPNPEIDFAASPFFVNTAPLPWEAVGGLPRVAGVSAFGLGGTNAHVVLTEAPPPEPPGPSRPWQLLPLSARSPEPLEEAAARLARHLAERPEQALADVAWTLASGRRELEHRAVVVCREAARAAALWTGGPAEPGEGLFTGLAADGAPPVVFLFPGQGAEHPAMGRGLGEERVFRRELEGSLALLRERTGVDLGPVFEAEAADGEAAALLARGAYAQPAVFAFELALARQWQAWGVEPEALSGHSLGELVAACLAGVFSLEDALAVAAARGRLLDALPAGAMLSVWARPEEIEAVLAAAGPGAGEVSLAVVNGPERCVVTGRSEAVAEVERRLVQGGTAVRRLEIPYPSHSPLVEPILDELRREVERVALNPPRIPLLSNVTGTWLSDREATDPGYWVRHLRQPVQFSCGLEELFSDPRRILLEVGAGRMLSTLAQRHPAAGPERLCLASLPYAGEPAPESATLLAACGRLWTHGVGVDWPALWDGERRRKMPLPTYPFQRRRYWIEPGAAPAAARTLGKNPDLAGWFYVPCWRLAEPPPPLSPPPEEETWWLLSDRRGLGRRLGELLAASGRRVVAIEWSEPGGAFARLADGGCRLDPRRAEDWRRLVAALLAYGGPPRRAVLLWGLDGEAAPEASADEVEEAQARGLDSFLSLVRALIEAGVTDPVEIAVVTGGAQAVHQGEEPSAARATVLGALRVVPQEHGNLGCRGIDVPPAGDAASEEAVAVWLAAELATAAKEPAVAMRGGERWVEDHEPLRVTGGGLDGERLRRGGVYLLVGGFGRAGRVLARYLARSWGARLVLTGRTPLPAREAWDGLLAELPPHDPVRGRIALVRELEAAGAEVLAVAADAADERRMAEVVAAARRRFGALHGVLHLAVQPRDELLHTVVETTPEVRRAGFAPKVGGLLALDAALAGVELDFCLLFSSISVVLGGLGMAAYAAANRFLDAFAAGPGRWRPGLWRSVAWDAWPGEVDAEALTYGRGLAELAMEPEEAAEAFRRALGLPGSPRLVVATADLAARAARWLAPARPEQEAEAPRERSSRPRLKTAYAPPTTPSEEAVAALWRELLGIERIGIHDGYFELGGDSLVGIQVIARLRRDFRVQLSVRDLMETPTVAGLAAVLDRRRGSEGPGDGALEELLEEIEAISDEEAWREIATRAEPEGPGSAGGAGVAARLPAPTTQEVDR